MQSSQPCRLWPAGLIPLSLALAPLAPAAALPAQGGDECSNATLIVGPGPHPLDATGATTSMPSESGCGFTFINDIWFEWTAPTTETYALEIESPPSYSVTITEGCGGTLVACQLGFRAENNPDHRVLFDAVQGTTYKIRTAHTVFGSQVGSLIIQPTVEPPNGECSLATPIAGDGTFAFDQASPRTTFQTTGCGQIDNDVWFRWTAPSDAFVHLSTPVRWTAMTVRDACGAEPVACDRHFGGPTGSDLTFRASAGTDYLIAIGTTAGLAPRAGTFSLETLRPSIEPSTGHAYQWVPEAMVYGDARQAAESMVYQGVQGHLVTLQSAVEDSFVRALMDEGRDRLGTQLPFGPGLAGAWSGLFQDTTAPDYSEPAGGWVWVTGEPVTYTNWIAPNRPDNFTGHGNGDENFMGLRGAWEDWPDRPLYYVVEWELDPVGTSFCDPASTNLTGGSTRLSALASPTSSTGVRLEANGGPQGAFGLIVMSLAADPFGVLLGNGRLCLSGPSLGRYSLSGTPLNSIGAFDGAGAFQNLSGTSSTGSGFDVPPLLPLTGAPPLMAGQTYFFQLWHRDGSTSSNLSNGVAVTF